MVEMDDLADKVFALLKGNGLQVKIFDEAGAETTDPETGRRFFVAEPNIMITINEPTDKEKGNIEFSKGKNVDNSIDGLQKNVRKIADEFQLDSSIKVFGKQIQPRDYAYQAKMKKGNNMMENNSVQPYNHQLMGKVLHKIKYFGSCAAYTLADDIGIDLSELQPVLNRLVTSGKVTAQPNAHGDMEYSVAVDEAVMESFSKMFGSVKTSQQTLENVRILVRHKTPIDENVRGSRSRHISAIFLEIGRAHV